MNIEKLASDWRKYKEEEREAVEARRECEDAMVTIYRINAQNEGTQTFEAGDFKVKVVSKMSRTVDSDKLQEIAAENGLNDELSRLFRWKADINSSAWKTATEQMRDVLSGAITTKAGRPTFSVDTTTTTKEQ